MSSTETTIRNVKKRYSVAPAPVIVQQTKPGTSMRVSYGGPSARRTNVRMSSSFGGGGGVMLPSGETAKVSKETVLTVKGTRGKEKKDLSELNGKLACYIEKGRLLEASNKALAEENDKLRKLKGMTGERVRDEYEEEIKELREALDALQKEMGPLRAQLMGKEDAIDTKELEIEELKKWIEDLKNQLDKSNQMLSDQEAETSALRKACDGLQRERDMLKKELFLCRDDNTRIRGDIDAARSAQIIAEQERDALAEQLEFLETSTTYEIEELKRVIEGFGSIRPKMEEMWKGEFKKAITDLQEEFDERLGIMCEENRIRYEDKLAHMQVAPKDNVDSVARSENKTLKSQLGDSKRKYSDYENKIASLERRIQELLDQMSREQEECEIHKCELKDTIAELRAELDAVNIDLAEIHDMKMSLELEIACYKKLLEGEESKMARSMEQQVNMQSRGGASLASVISGGMSGGGGGGGGSSSQSSSMSQSTGSIKVTRSSTCLAQISEVENQGKFICISNTGTKDMDLSGWSMTRNYPKKRSKKATEYHFENFILPVGKTVKVYSNEYSDSIEDDKVLNTSKGIITLLGKPYQCNDWGTGDGETALKNKDGQTKASAVVTHMMN